MSSTIEFARYAPVAGPVGPSLADWLARSLRRFADRRATPAKAQRDRQREAAEVREWAMQFEHTDPGFAADLFAAADRHELDPR